MNLFRKMFIVPVIFFLFYTATGYADTVLLRNGDQLNGKIQNEYFVVRASYSQIVVKKAFCKNITMGNKQGVIGSLKTINNDLFTGTLLNRGIQILLTDNSRQTISVSDLNALFFEISGPSRQVSTTVFTMGNGDRFSGKLLNPEIKLRTEYMTASPKRAEINRIDFSADDPDSVNLLLINGDRIQGNLLIDEMRIEPDSCAQITADKSKFSSIQFNARKMLLNKFYSSSSEQDDDRDGVAHSTDKCSSTPWGDQVDEDGCSTDKIAAQTVSPPVTTAGQSGDEDSDGVPDYSDKCPQTPLGARVNSRGCWSTQDILFDFDSYLIKSSYYPVLDNVMTVLKKNPTLKIEVQGSTDNIGPSAYNKTLSEKRAMAVKNYLIGKKIEPERLRAVGYGSTSKAASNDTAAGRALNRRIDFVIVN